MSLRINTLPPSQRALATRLEADARVGSKNGVITLEELQKAKALGLVKPSEARTFASLETKLKQLNPGGSHVTTPGAFEPWTGAAPTTPTTAVRGAVEHAFTRDGSSDTYTMVVGKNGIKPNGEMVLPVPADRQGWEIQNIDVSFHAPLRQWNEATKREEKPTYCEWFTDSTRLMRKFVDPNADNGNAPEVDNIHPENATDSGVLATAGKTIRIKAENLHIPPTENAMDVQWVRVSYKPKNVDVKTFSYRGEQLPNTEWKGKWIQTGQAFSIDVDPTRKVARVEIQWSDKPDDVGYNEPGKWALGTVTLDGATLGKPREHVGSPEWQTFEGRGAKGRQLSIRADDSPLKIFEVRVLYEK